MLVLGRLSSPSRAVGSAVGPQRVTMRRRRERKPSKLVFAVILSGRAGPLSGRWRGGRYWNGMRAPNTSSVDLCHALLSAPVSFRDHPSLSAKSNPRDSYTE